MLGPILLARYLHLQARYLVIYVSYRQWSILTVNKYLVTTKITVNARAQYFTLIFFPRTYHYRLPDE